MIQNLSCVKMTDAQLPLGTRIQTNIFTQTAVLVDEAPATYYHR